MPKKRYNAEEIIYPPPAYSGGLQPAPTELEIYCNHLNVLMIPGFRA
jgi:hypothetical protein